MASVTTSSISIIASIISNRLACSSLQTQHPPVSNAGYWIQLAVHVFHKIIFGFQLNWKKRIWIPTETRQHSWIPKATPNRRLDSKSKGQHSWIPKAPPKRRLDSKSKRRLHQDACWIPTKLLVLDWIPNLPPSSSFRCLDSNEATSS